MLACALTVAVTVGLAAAPPPAPAPARESCYVRLEHLRLVAIDPGHGGGNRGALGVDGTWEKAVTLAIAERLEAMLLEETSAAAALTRRDDRPLGLRERTRLANAWEADVFLSIHLNADAYGRGEGVEAWFLAPADEDEATLDTLAAEACDEDEHVPEDVSVPYPELDELLRQAEREASRAQSETLATRIAESLARRTGSRLRGVKQARFGVLVEADMPAVVVEAGFITHAEEGLRVVDPAHIERIARGVLDGLVAFDRQLGGAAPGGDVAHAE